MNRRRLGPEAPNAVGAPVARRQLGPGSQAFNVRGAVDHLRQLIAEAEAFATTVDDLYEEVGDDPLRHERLAWIVTRASVATQAAKEAGNKLAADLVEHGVGK